jgi:hypothetical protein
MGYAATSLAQPLNSTTIVWPALLYIECDVGMSAMEVQTGHEFGLQVILLGQLIYLTCSWFILNPLARISKITIFIFTIPSKIFLIEQS